MGFILKVMGFKQGSVIRNVRYRFKETAEKPVRRRLLEMRNHEGLELTL